MRLADPAQRGQLLPAVSLRKSYCIIQSAKDAVVANEGHAGAVVGKAQSMALEIPDAISVLQIGLKGAVCFHDCWRQFSRQWECQSSLAPCV